MTPPALNRGKNRPTTRAARVPAPVQPTQFQLLRRAEALGIDIKLGVDPKTGRLLWNNRHDLTNAVDALAVYRATNHLRRREAAGRLYAMDRRVTFGGVFPISTVLAQIVATSLQRGRAGDGLGPVGITYRPESRGAAD